MSRQTLLFFVFGLKIVPFFMACGDASKAVHVPKGYPKMDVPKEKLAPAEPPMAKVAVQKKVAIGGLFRFLDEVVRQNDTAKTHKLTEHLLLRANPWILDTLVRTDYYFQKNLGNFLFDQPKMIVLRPGDTLLVPGPETAAILLEKMAKTRLDINIPAFEMRILEGDSLLFSVPVRVGKNQKKFLEVVGREVDLRTRTGEGQIVRVNRNPTFQDPVTGKKFKFTKRDDHQTTLMPQIPWLEPAIDGRRLGQMIHPTTNPKTLGHAASNGCIGVSEADGWRVYFFAPVGTRVTIRYDLFEIKPSGDTLRYPNVYPRRKKPKTAALVAGLSELPIGLAAGICLCDSIF